jgi:ATP-binding cassette, subfamily B, bacterial
VKREYWKYLWVITPYLKRYRRLAATSMVLMILSAGFALLEPWPLAFLLDSVLGKHRPAGWITGLVGPAQGHLIIFVVLSGIGVVVVASGLGVIDSYVNTKLEQRMALDFRSDLFEHSQKLSQAFHDHASSGDFIYRINFEGHHVGAVAVAFPQLIQSVLTIVGMFVVTFALAPQLALLSLVVIPFVYYSVTVYARHVEPRLIKTRNLEALSLQIVGEVFALLKVVVSFNRERHEYERFRRQGEEAVRQRINVTVAQTLFSLAVGVFTACGQGLIMGFGAYLVIRRQLTLGELVVVISYVAAMYKPLQTISSTMSGFQEHFVALRFAHELAETVPEVLDSPDAAELDTVRGEIVFDDVSFDYRSRVGTLQDVSLSVEPGEVVAIVGPTGAGKTTLLTLLCRFYDPRSGRILIDGHDLRDLTQASIHRSISLVSQEPLLFPSSISDNIRYGKLEATDEEVIEAAKAANAHDFVMGLPEGYSTRLGERGSRLSGGERQRICIARAFLKAAPILILDEPTSSVDSRTEFVILEALERLMVGRTTFMIAHRLSTIRDATQIAVLNQGRLVEVGTHEQLLEAGGLYTLLYDVQSGASPRRLGRAAPAPDVAVHPQPALALDSAPVLDAAPVLDQVRTSALDRDRGRVVVVLGMMSKIPVAGVIWQTVHYLVGLKRLGFDVYYVEAHARTPSMFMETENDDGSAKAATFIDGVMRRFGLEGHWAFHALHDNGSCHGMSIEQLQQLYRSAALIINLHGGTNPLPEHAATGRLIYIETDPVQLQVELHDGVQETIDFLEPHAAFFTFGENLGRPDCLLPVSDRFAFHPTRQPVALDFWSSGQSNPGPLFTTIGNWRQQWRDVKFRGETYSWSKDREFEKLLDLPQRTSQPFELALGSYTEEDEQLLRQHGWLVRPGLDFSLDVDRYRDYVLGSRGEFTVAKDQNVRLRSGWFSDRSATYLAAGRPVITQETGFSNVLPTGNGLFAFETMEDVLAAIEAVNGAYAHHRDAALDIAREYFAYDRVLLPILEHVDLAPARHGHHQPRTDEIPRDLVLTPLSKRPLELRAATLDTLLDRPLPAPNGDGQTSVAPSRSASLIVVTYNNLALTRLCLDSILANSHDVEFEVIVVDNASTDGTVEFVTEMARRFDEIQIVRNEANDGFAHAVNQGLAIATREALVIMNDDVVVTPGWLAGLLAHLDDPMVGLVGPTTNAAPNEARITTTYGTYGQLTDFATERQKRFENRSFDMAVSTMFCTALRRDVFERVGPLDERFLVGQFEDDDYAIRVRAEGFRVVCAEGVFVHHFGEASFGKLAPSGEQADLFHENRRRFEDKWGIPWSPHEGRVDPSYQRMKESIRALARREGLPWRDVLVVSKGDDELLELDGVTAGHFPQEPDKTASGHHPTDSAGAIEHLDSLRDAGAGFLVIPETSRWWLDHYEGLRDHLERTGTKLADEPETCVVFALRKDAPCIDA